MIWRQQRRAILFRSASWMMRLPALRLNLLGRLRPSIKLRDRLK
jgi:hypothetical protein